MRINLHLNNSIIPDLRSGEHNITIQVTDEAGNQAVETTIFQIALHTIMTTTTTSSSVYTTSDKSSSEVSSGFRLIHALTIVVLIIMSKKKGIFLRSK